MNLKSPTLITSINDDEILLCLKTLYSTYKDSCPLAREFGISIDIISKPYEVAKAIYAQEIIDITAEYIPDIEVLRVEFEDNAEGYLKPVIYLERKEEIDGFDF